MENKAARYLQMDEKGRWIISFGKYKGDFLDDIMSEDPGYFDWFLTQDIPERVRDIIEENKDQPGSKNS